MMDIEKEKEEIKCHLSRCQVNPHYRIYIVIFL